MQTQCVFELLLVSDGLWSMFDVHFTRSDGAITFIYNTIQYNKMF